LICRSNPIQQSEFSNKSHHQKLFEESSAQNWIKGGRQYTYESSSVTPNPFDEQLPIDQQMWTKSKFAGEGSPSVFKKSSSSVESP
jgi:hypothetical protein